MIHICFSFLVPKYMRKSSYSKFAIITFDRIFKFIQNFLFRWKCSLLNETSNVFLILNFILWLTQLTQRISHIEDSTSYLPNNIPTQQQKCDLYNSLAQNKPILHPNLPSTDPHPFNCKFRLNGLKSYLHKQKVSPQTFYIHLTLCTRIVCLIKNFDCDQVL